MAQKANPATRHVISINDLSDKDIEAIFDMAQAYLNELPDPHFPYRIGRSTKAASNYILTFFSCRAPSNWSDFCDPAIERSIRRALALQNSDPYLANQLWARIDRAIVDAAPVVPLVTLKQSDIVSRRVKNYQDNPQWGVLLDQLWVR